MYSKPIRIAFKTDITDCFVFSDTKSERWYGESGISQGWRESKTFVYTYSHSTYYCKYRFETISFVDPEMIGKKVERSFRPNGNYVNAPMEEERSGRVTEKFQLDYDEGSHELSENSVVVKEFYIDGQTKSFVEKTLWEVRKNRG